MANGKYVSGKGFVGAPEFDTDETIHAQTRQLLDEEPYKSRVIAMKKEIADSKEKSKKALEPFKMAKGGKVSSASKRADGCAVRGKTRA
jgi:phage gp16-like protein